MLSARSLFHEIKDCDEAYRLFLSVAAKNEAQGGWENARIAALTRDRAFALRIARHGEDEAKHGRLFGALLARRGLEPVEVPADTDYCMLLERQGIGISHARLARDEPLSDEELIAYLAHSRVTEQRAAEEIALQKRVFGDDPELGKAVRMIADDEERHLAYCHEELLRFAAAGHGVTVRRLLRRYARAEIRTYRDVSLAVMGRMGAHCGWPAWKRRLLALGIRAVYAMERLVTWRRHVRLVPPAVADAMGPRAAA
jgi:hypothetical protein